MRTSVKLLGVVVVAVVLAFGPGCQRLCEVAGTGHNAGTTFPAPDGCNTCSCSANGTVACTTRACVDGGPAPAPTDAGTCDFKTTYSYGQIGGFRATERRTTLSPGNNYRHVLSTIDRGNPPVTKSCQPPMPACGALDIITSYDIEVHDLSQPDVVAALAAPTPPLFGRDLRPVDGAVFEFLRADGSGFLVGAECNGQSGCAPITRGIKQLRDRLLALDQQQLADPSCASLRQGL
jgi:hypothetical protein